jgi:serine phosphatase RsbU (regulator of sigma subunit)
MVGGRVSITPQGSSVQEHVAGTDEPFHSLTELAARLLRAPFAAVTFRDPAGNLVDGTVGLLPPPPDAERVIRPMCAEVISSGRPLVIRDLRSVPRFSVHPDIVRLGLRAYAGIPLRMDGGAAFGAFCVLDDQPHDWTDEELSILEGLAAAAVSELRLRLGMHRASNDRRDAEQARARLQFLADASAALAESLDYETTLETVARLTVPRAADWCAVHLRTDDGSLCRLVLQSSPPDDDALRGLAAYDTYPPDHPVGAAAVTRTGRTEVVPKVTDEWLGQLALDEHHKQLFVSLGWQWAVVAPMRLHGKTVGTLSCAGLAPFDPQDVMVVEQLANRVAVAVENARLYEERDTVAQTLQRSLLPPTLPQIPGLEHGVRYRPAQAGALVCGDFFDLFQTGSHDWVAAIGDVCGKGLQAATLAGLARHVIRTAALQVDGPSAVLRVLNDALRREDSVPEDARFCTALCLHVQPGFGDSGRPTVVTLASGGHPPPLVLRRGGEVETVDCSGLLLGPFAVVDAQDVRVELDPGDAIVMFTDGVTEARSGGELFSTCRLAETVAACRGLYAQAIADEVARAVGEWAGDIVDDLAILVLRNAP